MIEVGVPTIFNSANLIITALLKAQNWWVIVDVTEQKLKLD